MAAVGLSSRRVNAMIEQATVLVGSDRHLSYFPDHPAQRIRLGNLPDGDRLHPKTLLSSRPPSSPSPPSVPSPQIIHQKSAKSASYTIVILVSGDPLIFWVGATAVALVSSSRCINLSIPISVPSSSPSIGLNSPGMMQQL